MQCGWYFSLGHQTQHCSDFNQILALRRQEHVLPVCGPTQEQRSMVFCHPANQMHLFDLAFSTKFSSQMSICTEHGYCVYFDYILFRMHILIFQRNKVISSKVPCLCLCKKTLHCHDQDGEEQRAAHEIDNWGPQGSHGLTFSKVWG